MTTEPTPRASKFSAAKGRALIAATVLSAATLLGAGPAAAQSCLVDEGVTVTANPFVPAFAVTLPGPMVAVNFDYGAGLGRETQAWLIERQCYLAANYAANAVPSPEGVLEFSSGAHTDADCEAYVRVVEAESGRATVTRVIDRDVSREQRGDYWDIGLGDYRPVSSTDCR